MSHHSKSGMGKTYLLVCTVLLAMVAISPDAVLGSAEIEHVVLMIIDGVRPDRLLEASTPNLDALASEGSYTSSAWTTTPSVTLAAIPAIVTGAAPEAHGVTDWLGEIRAETLVEVFVEAELTTFIIGAGAILGGYSSTWNIEHDLLWGDSGDPEAEEKYTDTAIDSFKEERPFFVHLYNPIPDRTGHSSGEDSDEYRQAIERADHSIGRFIDTLKELDVYEESLIVLTTDHGFTGFSHSGGNPTDMQVFSIWRGPGIRRGYVMSNNVYVPAGTTYDETYVAHHIVDISPTIAALVGVRPPANATGRIIAQILEDESLRAEILERNVQELREELRRQIESSSARLDELETQLSSLESESRSQISELEARLSTWQLYSLVLLGTGLAVGFVTGYYVRKRHRSR